MRSIAWLFLLLAVSRAASIATLPLPPAFQLVLDPGSAASTSVFSLTCRGFSFVGGYRSIPPLIYPPNPPDWALSEFIGANPNCLMRGLDPLPGQRNTPTAEGLQRFSRAQFQNVWSGIDAEISVNAPPLSAPNRSRPSAEGYPRGALMSAPCPQGSSQGTGLQLVATTPAVENGCDTQNGTENGPVPSRFAPPSGFDARNSL